MKVIGFLAFVGAIVFGCVGHARGEGSEIWTIGFQNDSRDEFGVSVTPGSEPDGPFTFDVDIDADPCGFPNVIAGPDELDDAGIQMNDFNPLTIAYSAQGVSEDAVLLIDIARLRNTVDRPAGNDGTFRIDVSVGQTVLGVIMLTGVDHGEGNCTPEELGISDVYTFVVPGGLIGQDIKIEVTDGAWCSFDYLSLSRAAGDIGVEVLQVNGETHDATVSVGDPIIVELAATGSGPDPACYVLWAWRGEPVNPFTIDIGNSVLGCTVNPTPFQPLRTPQAFKCLNGGFPETFCAGLDLLGAAPAKAPWSVTRAQGFDRAATFTLQGAIQDDGANNQDQISITNAVVLRIVE